MVPCDVGRKEFASQFLVDGTRIAGESRHAKRFLFSIVCTCYRWYVRSYNSYKNCGFEPHLRGDEHLQNELKHNAMRFDIFHFRDKHFTRKKIHQHSLVNQSTVFQREQIFPNVLPTRVGSNKTIQNRSHKLTIFLGVLRYPTIRGRLQIGLLHHFFKAIYTGPLCRGSNTTNNGFFTSDSEGACNMLRKISSCSAILACNNRWHGLDFRNFHDEGMWGSGFPNGLRRW